MKEPTNSQLYEKLGKIETTVSDIHTQVKKTNGRVTALERWREKLDIIELYKKEAGGAIDWNKIIIAALGIITTMAAIISYLVQR